jgi:hypothetical protein
MRFSPFSPFSPFFPHALSAALLAAFAPASASAAEEPEPAPQPVAERPFPKTALQFGLGPNAALSTWRGDVAGGGSLRIGLLLLGAVAPDFITRLNYASVDDRVATYLSLGVTGYLPLRLIRPYARLAFVHQHEESRAAIGEDPSHAALGVGHGIRHRAGYAGGLGLDVPVLQRGRSTFTFGGDVTATRFPDPRGPELYVAATFLASIHHAL